MFALTLLGSALLAGLAWASLLPGRLLWPERIAAGVVAAVFGAAWMGWLAVLGLGYAGGAVAASLALLALAALGWRRGRVGRPHVAPVPRGLRTPWLATTLPLSALLAYLDHTHFLAPLDGGWGSAGSTWGDLALHASLTARFAQEPRFEWDLPLLAGAPLTYPFLPDFLSGLLHRGGASMRWALLAPTLLLGLSLVQLLFFAAWRAARSRVAAVVACLLVLFDGSAAGLPVFWRELAASGRSLFDYLRAIRHDFAHVPAINLRFSNIVCDALLPQRGMLAGLSAFLAAALLLRGAWELERAAPRARAGTEGAAAKRPIGAAGALAGAGVLLGLLPLVHVHSFLVLAGVMGWLALARSLHRRTVARGWLAALGLGLVLAAPQLAWQLSHSFDRSFSHWQLGWMTMRGESPIAFWVRNLGVLVPFLAAAPWTLRRWPARSFWLHLLAPCLALFAVANVYLFQPHAYDNLKLLFYAFLALAVVTAKVLAGWWRRGWAARALAVACVLLATAAGGMSVLRESILRWPLLDRDEVALGFELRRLTPPDARFLTADLHDHPVPMVAGRRIVLGYRGWLWTYGLDVAPVLADVRAIYAGAAGAEELLRRYRVDYVVVGPGERESLHADEAFFAARYPLLVSRGAYRVFRVAEGEGDAAGLAGGGVGTNVLLLAGRTPANRSASK